MNQYIAVNINHMVDDYTTNHINHQVISVLPMVNHIAVLSRPGLGSRATAPARDTSQIHKAVARRRCGGGNGGV